MNKDIQRTKKSFIRNFCAELISRNSKFMLHNSRQGFTVVELIVAVGLFSVIMSIAAGGLVRAFRTQRQTAAMMAANSNASLVLEQMTRELRTSYSFQMTSSLPCAANEEISFTNAKNQNITYCRQVNGRGIIIKRIDVGDFRELTAENVDVKYLKFYPLGEALGDGSVARVTMTVGINPASAEVSVKDVQVNLQTTISSRQVDS